MKRFALVVAFTIIAALTAGAASAQTERVVDIPTRTGQSVRALLTVPDKPIGSVVLLAGGHGRLDLSPDGRIGWGTGNQVVRTRALYAKAGYATLVPDIAPDMKTRDGVVNRYRWSPTHASDIGHLVAYMRKLAQPVHLIGTSRAALSVANAATRTTGGQAPDSIVITSGMLGHGQERQPSVQKNVPHLERITQPTLLIAHKDDTCFVTPPSAVGPFAKLLTGAKRVDVKILSGGSPLEGNPCEAKGPHGFKGMDPELVRTVLDWIAAQRP